MTVTSPNEPDAPDAPEIDTPESAAPPADRAPRGSTVATILTAHLSFYLLIWIGIGAVLLTINLVANGIDGDVETSGWSNQTSVFQYALLAGGIVVVTGYVPRMVTQGVTRRTTASASLAAVGLLAVGGALATLVGAGIEQIVFSINDWPYVLDRELADLHIYDRPDQYGLMFVEFVTAYVAHVVAGLIIGAGYYRFGWVWGAPTMLVGIALAVVSEFLARSGFVGVRLGEALGIEPPAVALGIAGTVALTLAGAWAVVRLVGAMPIETRHASWWR